MAVPRINIKSIDYFKFKKLVIDGNRDDYNGCSKEVKALCDCVQTLNFRDEEFDDVSDRGRFEEVCLYYQQVLASKRIDPTDMRIKSGWWGDHKNAYSAGKLKPMILKDILVAKASQWYGRHGDSSKDVQTAVEGPGLYVLKHKEHQCFQYVGRADRIFARFAERLKAAFEGSVQEPLASLLVISMAEDWDFYFIPVEQNDGDKVLRILENDLILKHDSIWPHGLNFRLHIDSLLEVSEFRKSCLRHKWPPDSDTLEDFNPIDLSKLRLQVESEHSIPVLEESVAPSPAKARKAPAASTAPPPPPVPAAPVVPPAAEPDEESERPLSALSAVTSSTSSSNDSGASGRTITLKSASVAVPGGGGGGGGGGGSSGLKPKASAQGPRPTSGGRRSQGGNATGRSTDRPTSAVATSKPGSKSSSSSSSSSGIQRPTTPKRRLPVASKAQNGTPPGDNPNASEQPDVTSPESDEADNASIPRSHSGSSLSSADAKSPSASETPDGTPKKSPVAKKRGPTTRPASAKVRQDKSRLPVSSAQRQ